MLDKKGFDFKLVDAYFDENYFVEKLRIPVQYVNGFKYYIVENEFLIENIKNKNKVMVEFLIIELANDYKKRIAFENKY